MRIFFLKQFLVISLFLWSSFCFSQNEVHVEDLSLASQISIETMMNSGLPSNETARGFYFKYFRLSSDRGLLVPIRDQSLSSAGDQRNFAPVALDGLMPQDVAASLYDKIDQLRRLALVGGPEVLQIAWIKDAPDAEHYTELGLIVEHMEGRRLPIDPTRATAEETEKYFDLLLESSAALGSDGPSLLPLDAHAGNILIVGAEVRPVDIVLATAMEIENIKKSNPKLHRLRLHQAAYTLATGEASLAAHPTAPQAGRCNELFKQIRESTRVPDEIHNFAKSRLKVFRGAGQAAQPVAP